MSIEGEWATYSKVSLPPDAGPVQTMETKRAFYGGAGAFFTLSRDVAEMEEAPAMVALGELNMEIEEFFKNVGQGN